MPSEGLKSDELENIGHQYRMFGDETEVSGAHLGVQRLPLRTPGGPGSLASIEEESFLLSAKRFGLSHFMSCIPGTCDSGI